MAVRLPSSTTGSVASGPIGDPGSELDAGLPYIRYPLRAMLVRVSLGIDDERLRTQVLDALPFAETLVVGRAGKTELLETLSTRTADLLLVDADGAEALEPLAAASARHPDRPQLVALLRTDDLEVHAQALAVGVGTVIDASVPTDVLAPALSTLVAKRREVRLAESVVVDRARRRSMPRLVSASAAMDRVLATAQRVAHSDSPVLLLGETGVGKERIAEVVHRASDRVDGPFVPVNCAAIPSELFEAELFGHERGAYTGAERARRGLFELAHEGTLFLDEVGEVPLAMQSKLLRALQDNAVRPLGGARAIEVDVRVVAATNRNLLDEVGAGRFRSDLYYRLCVVELSIPPLRERPGDIEALAPVLAEHFSARLGRPCMEVSSAAMASLLGYSWPGNVRELANVLERAVLLADGPGVELGDLPPVFQVTPPSRAHDPPPDRSEECPVSDAVVRLPPSWRNQHWKAVREEILEAGERAYLSAVLAESEGKVGEAASRAGMSTRALFDKMRRHRLRKEDFR